MAVDIKIVIQGMLKFFKKFYCGIEQQTSNKQKKCQKNNMQKDRHTENTWIRGVRRLFRTLHISLSEVFQKYL